MVSYKIWGNLKDLGGGVQCLWPFDTTRVSHLFLLEENDCKMKMYCAMLWYVSLVLSQNSLRNSA